MCWMRFGFCHTKHFLPVNMAWQARPSPETVLWEPEAKVGIFLLLLFPSCFKNKISLYANRVHRNHSNILDVIYRIAASSFTRLSSICIPFTLATFIPVMSHQRRPLRLWLQAGAPPTHTPGSLDVFLLYQNLGLWMCRGRKTELLFVFLVVVVFLLILKLKCTQIKDNIWNIVGYVFHTLKQYTVWHSHFRNK